MVVQVGSCMFIMNIVITPKHVILKTMCCNQERRNMITLRDAKFGDLSFVRLLVANEVVDIVHHILSCARGVPGSDKVW